MQHAAIVEIDLYGGNFIEKSKKHHQMTRNAMCITCSDTYNTAAHFV